MIANKSLATFCENWALYQTLLIEAIAPLSAEQLALRPHPRLRSVGAIMTHIVCARARWLYLGLGEGGQALEAMVDWDKDTSPIRSATELVDALNLSRKVLHAGLDRWTSADLEQIMTVKSDGDTETFSRQWVIWHLIEHDLHHGGEISLVLGMNGLAAVDI